MHIPIHKSYTRDNFPENLSRLDISPTVYFVRNGMIVIIPHHDENHFSPIAADVQPQLSLSTLPLKLAPMTHH